MPRTTCRSSVRALLGLVQQLAGGLGITVVGTLGQPDPHRQGHQPRLRAVVQIPLDPAQLGTVRGDRVGPGLRQLLDPRGQLRPRRRHEQRGRPVGLGPF
ncbi:hypothetical protein SNL152K_5298 [Streptomyces sp. NL15-2K]|nr:hypothetical protein SNL152K_5298 [Streptomyces sp. NL15-2K]